MISVDIPGFADVRLEHLVLDFNGTLAEEGTLLARVRPLIVSLARILQIHVVTADTFGCATAELAGLPLQLTLLPSGDQAVAKLQQVQALGVERVIAIGNGRNDRLMLRAAALGIAVIQREGAAVTAIIGADIIATSIIDALKLVGNSTALAATLRS